MIIVLLFIAVSLAIGVVSYFCAEYMNKHVAGITGTLITALVFVFISGIGFLVSWDSVVDISKYRATVSEYATTIELYSDKGVNDFKQRHRAVTDMKYNSYQSTMGEMIMDLRNVIIRHNRIIAGKERHKANPFFNWFVVMPDDTRMLKLGDYI